MKEILRLADRVSVLRDGSLVGTRPATELDHATLVRMMVGRPIGEVMHRKRHATATPVLESRPDLSSSKVHDINLTVHKGEVVGLAGLIGAGRTELGQDDCSAPSATIAARSKSKDTAVSDPQRRRTPSLSGIAYAPEERKADALLLELPVSENASMAILRRLTRFRIVERRRRTRDRRRVMCSVCGSRPPRSASRSASSRAATSRKSSRPLARDEAQDADTGRAHARHRCRRQGRDL